MEDDRKDRKVGAEERSVYNIGNENGRIEVRCPVCSRSFRSKKVMHGHMRCHPERGWRGVKKNPPPPLPNAAKKTASSSCLSNSSTARTDDDASLPLKKRRQYASSNNSKRSLLQKSHECRTCGKSFPTGQALGGHQTCHRQPKPPQSAPLILLREDQAARHNPNPSVVLDFDLNQLPPMDEE